MRDWVIDLVSIDHDGDLWACAGRPGRSSDGQRDVRYPMLIRSTDDGDAWQPLAPPGELANCEHASVHASAGAPASVWLRTADGIWWLGTADGAWWPARRYPPDHPSPAIPAPTQTELDGAESHVLWAWQRATLLRSADLGVTWVAAGQFHTTATRPVRQFSGERTEQSVATAAALIAPARIADRLYLITSGRLWVTLNRGDSWREVRPPTAPAHSDTGSPLAWGSDVGVAIAPVPGGVAIFTARPAGLDRSIDDGTNWTRPVGLEAVYPPRQSGQ